MKKVFLLSIYTVCILLFACSKSSCDGEVTLEKRVVLNSNPGFIDNYPYEDICFNVEYAARVGNLTGNFNRIQIKLVDAAWKNNPAGEAYMLIDFWLNNSNIKGEDGFENIMLASENDILVVASEYQPNGAPTNTDYNPNYGVANTDLRTGFQNLKFSINKEEKTISMEFDGLVGVRSNYSFIQFIGNTKLQNLKINNI